MAVEENKPEPEEPEEKRKPGRPVGSTKEALALREAEKVVEANKPKKKAGRPKGTTKEAINKAYDLKDVLLDLLRVQSKRIQKAADEEAVRWSRKKEDRGTRHLDPGLSKEIQTAMALAETLFKVGGASEGKVKTKEDMDKDVVDQVEKLDAMLKKKMVNLARQANGGGEE